MVIIGLGVPWLVVGLNTLLQRRTPVQLLGRVGTAVSTLVGTPQVLSMAFGAALVGVVAYRLLLGTVAAVVFGCAVYLASRRGEPAVSSAAVTAVTADEPSLSGRAGPHPPARS
jgi:hypothetical protein